MCFTHGRFGRWQTEWPFEVFGSGYRFAALFTYWVRDIDAHVNNMGLLVVAPLGEDEIAG